MMMTTPRTWTPTTRTPLMARPAGDDDREEWTLRVRCDEADRYASAAGERQMVVRRSTGELFILPHAKADVFPPPLYRILYITL